VRPPRPFEGRPATLADAAEVAALMNAFERAHLEEPDEMSASEVTDWWARLDPPRDTLLLRDSAGVLAAAGTLKEEGDEVLELDGFVHPERMGLGLGGFLLDWLEAEAARRDRPVVRTAALAADASAKALVAGVGYVPVRHFYRMLIDLDEPPPDPAWPAGFAVSTFAPGEEAILHAVTEEAFADHWGHDPRSLDDWQRTVFSRDWWDPSLVYLVRSGEEVVAAEISALRFGMGWIGTLGTRKRWRGRGLGRALLVTAFAELYRRGEPRIGLAVDAGNETGATQLYESAGMRVVSQADIYEKRVPR
jgi:mycothiol synthase